MNLLLLLSLAIPLSCLALLVSLALLGILTLGGVIHLIAEVGRAPNRTRPHHLDYRTSRPKRCSAHGLRKAACRRFAEAGCSAPEIMSNSGHGTMKELVRYTKAADQARLARNALAKAVIR
jgi:hypothetical protein